MNPIIVVSLIAAVGSITASMIAAIGAKKTAQVIHMVDGTQTRILAELERLAPLAAYNKGQLDKWHEIEDRNDRIMEKLESDKKEAEGK